MIVSEATWADAAETVARATINGNEVYVTLGSDIPECRALLKWVDDGGGVGPFEPTASPPRTIAGAYFRAALTDLGHMATVRAALTDPIDLELFNTASEFNESAPDVNAVATALSIDLSLVFDRAEVIRAARQS